MAEFKTGDEAVESKAQRMADLAVSEIEKNPDTSKRYNDENGDTAVEWLAGAILVGQGYAVQHFGGALYAAKTKEILNADTTRPDVQ